MNDPAGDRLLHFTTESDNHSNHGTDYNFKIIIADDDRDVHTVTHLVLKDFRFEHAGLIFIDTYSGKETIQALQENPDTAVLLLDVVMEDNTSGLDVVEYTRRTLGNNITRIILKTGQPGAAPEERVIVEYDINDYKSKSELTAQKFKTTLYTALRNFRDLKKLENHKKGLEKVIESSADFYHYNNLKDFFFGLLEQLNNLRNFQSDAFMASKQKIEEKDGFIAYSQEKDFRIIAGTGRFSSQLMQQVKKIENMNSLEDFMAQKGENSLYYRKYSNCFIGYYKGFHDTENLIYLEGDLHDINEEMIRLFLTNFTFAFDRLFMNRKLMGGMKQIIMMLGELIEYRDGETGSHVKRVSEMVHLLAKNSGRPEEICEDISIASMVHDIGKIAINDSILRKPGKLTPEEFEIVKAHTTTGYSILKGSTLGTIRMAADIALNHHEKWAGGGYPNGISGQEIPWPARLTALVDVFDALANKRYYKEAWPEEKIFELIEKERGVSFDPELVDLFVASRSEIMRIQRQYPDS